MIDALNYCMKPVLFALALLSLVGLASGLTHVVPARASSNSTVEPVSERSCVDRYNSLLNSAKAALSAGDRATTVHLLERAKTLIPACPGLQDVDSAGTLSLS